MQWRLGWVGGCSAVVVVVVVFRSTPIAQGTDGGVGGRFQGLLSRLSPAGREEGKRPRQKVARRWIDAISPVQKGVVVCIGCKNPLLIWQPFFCLGEEQASPVCPRTKTK